MASRNQASKSAAASIPTKASPERSRTGAAPGSVTSERDEVYGVVSVLYHALQGAETYAQYVQDAKQAGDSELEEFFQETLQQERERARRAKALLSERIEDDMEDDEDEDEDEDDSA
jgi:hypothetical protein